MVRRMALSLVLISLFSFTAQAGDKQKQTKSFPAGKIRTVTILCPGKCTLNNYSSGTINLDGIMTSSGTVYGFKHISATPFDIITQQFNDSLVISTTPFSRVVTFGFSTYEETLELNISLPLSVKVVYVNCEKELDAEITKQNIASIYCNARKGAVIEGSSQQNIKGEKREAEFFGSGSQYYSLIANNIKMALK